MKNFSQFLLITATALFIAIIGCMPSLQELQKMEEETSVRILDQTDTKAVVEAMGDSPAHAKARASRRARRLFGTYKIEQSGKCTQEMYGHADEDSARIGTYWRCTFMIKKVSSFTQNI